MRESLTDGLLRLWVRLVALLVPLPRRRDWMREWRGEIDGDRGAGVPASTPRPPVAETGWTLLRDAWEVRRLTRRGRRAERGADLASRASRGWSNALGQDLRYAGRTLARTPAFAAAVVAVLALGIGANASIFAVVNGLMLQPLPYPDPDELVMIWETHPDYPGGDFATSMQGLADWQRALERHVSLAGFTGRSMTLEGGEWPERLEVVEVSERYFRLLGIEPHLGRGLGPADYEVPEPRVVVLSHALWQRRFGGDPGIVGRTVSLTGESYEVVGVLGADFWYFDPYGMAPADAFKPLTAASFEGFDRGDRLIRVVGRLRQGSSLEALRASLDSLAGSIAAAHPETHEGWGLEAVPLHAEVVDDVRDNVLLLLAAVGFVLAVACFNVANLLLARGAGRRRELAVRSALGAGRWRLLRLQVVETVFLAVLGGALGLLGAFGASRALAALSPADLPLTDRIGVDPTVVAVVLGVSVLLGLVMGGFGAWQSGRADQRAVLGEGGRGATGGRRRSRVRATLVGAEVALSLVLLSGAGLLLNSYARLLAVDPGFEPAGVLTFQTTLWGRYWDSEEGDELTAAFFDRLLDDLSGLPGVVAAGGTSHLPFSGWNMSTRFHPPDEPPEDVEALPRVGFRRVTPGYFEAMELSVVKGRPFRRLDRRGSRRVIVVNRAFVNAHLSGEDPLGRELVLVKGTSLPPDPWRIVGVVENVKHHELAERDRSIIYVPHAQDLRPSLRLVVRTEGDPLALAGSVRRLVREIDPRQPVANFERLGALVGDSLAVPRFYAAILGMFAAAAVLLAAVGIGGVVSYGVQQRVREIGIRVALGADSSTVVRWMVASTMLPVGIGLAVGLPASLAASRALSSLLFQIGPADPTTLASTAALLAAVALLAAWMPARRAARVDPLRALGAS